MASQEMHPNMRELSCGLIVGKESLDARLCSISWDVARLTLGFGLARSRGGRRLR